MCIFPGRSLLTKLWYLALVLIGRHDDHPDVTYRQVRELYVTARPPIPVQLDGEPAGETPTLVQVMPGALRVLVGGGRPRRWLVRRAMLNLSRIRGRLVVRAPPFSESW